MRIHPLFQLLTHAHPPTPPSSHACTFTALPFAHACIIARSFIRSRLHNCPLFHSLVHACLRSFVHTWGQAGRRWRSVRGPGRRVPAQHPPWSPGEGAPLSAGSCRPLPPPPGPFPPRTRAPAQTKTCRPNPATVPPVLRLPQRGLPSAVDGVLRGFRGVQKVRVGKDLVTVY
jgi:hypothetical protein